MFKYLTSLSKFSRLTRHYSTHTVSKGTPVSTKSPSQIAQETKARNNSLDLMSDIMRAEDRRHGGNNADMPRRKPDVLLTRRDDVPTKFIQPSYGTHKSAIGQDGTLQPVSKHGTTSPALHIDGKKEVKEHSPYTSFSGVQTGVDGKAPHQLVDSPMYGKNRIVTNPSKDAKGGEVLDQFDLQRDIRTSPHRSLDDTAVLRSEPRPQSLWKPTEEERAIMPSVGVDPEQSSFTFRERAMVNSARDLEYLIKGPITNFELQVPDKNGGLKTLSKDEVLALVRKETLNKE